MQMKASGTLRYLNLLPKFILGKIVPQSLHHSQENKECLEGFASCVGQFCQCGNKIGLLPLAVVPCVFYKPWEDASLRPTPSGGGSFSLTRKWAWRLSRQTLEAGVLRPGQWLSNRVCGHKGVVFKLPPPGLLPPREWICFAPKVEPTVLKITERNGFCLQLLCSRGSESRANNALTFYLLLFIGRYNKDCFQPEPFSWCSELFSIPCLCLQHSVTSKG